MWSLRIIWELQSYSQYYQSASKTLIKIVFLRFYFKKVCMWCIIFWHQRFTRWHINPLLCGCLESKAKLMSSLPQPGSSPHVLYKHQHLCLVVCGTGWESSRTSFLLSHASSPASGHSQSPISPASSCILPTSLPSPRPPSNPHLGLLASSLAPFGFILYVWPREMF